MPEEDFTIDGTRGTLFVRRWDAENPQRIVVLVHGIGEHSGRYDYVAARLAASASTVFAADHYGHGRSDGERGLVPSIEALVDDLELVVGVASSQFPDLPLALLGHSLGGMVVTRALQRGGVGVAAAVLTGPPIGGNPAFEGVLAMDPLPDVPIDPAVLSRDPKVGEAYAQDPLVYHGPLSRATLEAILVDGVGAIKSGPTFGSVPVLWLHGEGDQLAPIDQTRPVIERLGGDRLQVRTYPDAQHEILNETNRDEVIDEIINFLADNVIVATPVAS
jgi:alpha-beta hydrolase superfamily lysophospholipase